MTPLNGTIIVRPDPVKEMTSGGIALSDGSKHQPGHGTVLFVDQDYGALVKPEDKIYYPLYCAIPVPAIEGYSTKDGELVRINLKEAWFVLRGTHNVGVQP